MVKRTQHIGTFLHSEMAISLDGMSPMCGCASIHLSENLFLKVYSNSWYQEYNGIRHYDALPRYRSQFPGSHMTRTQRAHRSARMAVTSDPFAPHGGVGSHKLTDGSVMLGIAPPGNC